MHFDALFLNFVILVLFYTPQNFPYAFANFVNQFLLHCLYILLQQFVHYITRLHIVLIAFNCALLLIV